MGDVTVAPEETTLSERVTALLQSNPQASCGRARFAYNPIVRRIGDIELSEDMRHEQREWVVQRVGWAAMGAFIAAALLGLFGSGPLADARAKAPGIELRYGRFGRHQAPDLLEVRFAAGSKMWVGAETFDRGDIERLSPEPSSVRFEADRVVYEFAGPGPGRVFIELTPKRIGWLPIRVGADGGSEVRVRQLVFP